MVELMQQAGSALPDSGWTMIRREDGGLLVAVNPPSAWRFKGAATPSSPFVAPASLSAGDRIYRYRMSTVSMSVYLCNRM